MAAPSSGIGGGLIGKMNASFTPISAPNARRATACAECSAPARWSQSFSVTKAIAEFCPEPEKLKPSTLAMLWTSGCLSMKASTCSITLSVRLAVAPGGSCTLTNRLPWSSFGRNEVGSRSTSQITPATIARYTSIMRRLRVSSLASTPS